MYAMWCIDSSRPPLNNQSLQDYVLQCYRDQFSFAKPNNVVSGLLFWCKLNNIQFEVSPLTRLGMQGYKRIKDRIRPIMWVPIQHLLIILRNRHAVNGVYYDLCAISFFTLVRPAELLILRWKNVFFKDRYIWMPWSKNDPNAHGTFVTLLQPAFLAFRRIYSDLARAPDPEDLVFDLPQTSFNPWLKAVCARLQLPPYTWYHFKHGGATWLAIKGWPLSKIQAHGRWKSDQSAKVYIHAPVHT